MDLNFNTSDTAAVATMGLPEFVEDVAKPETPAEGAVADPDTGDRSEGNATEVAKAAVEGAPASPAATDLEAVIAAESAAEAEQAKEAGKEHNFALLRAANKRLEAERDDALRVANEARTAGQPKLEEPPDLATMDKQIADLRAEAKRLAEEYPDMGMDKAANLNADILAGMRARIARDEQAVANAQETERKRLEAAALDQQAVAQDHINTVVAADPVMTHWAAKDAKSYALAAEQDALLASQPAWQGVAFEKRLAAVKELVKALNPEATLPEAEIIVADKVVPGGVKVPTVPAKPGAPIHSLSDVPGGVPAAANELENLLELSPAVIGNKFSKMTREQQDSYLSSLGVGATM